MKIKKLPNGFGSIVYLGANRRKPWAARKSINGKYKYLGYFKTYEDAFIFLLKYNKKQGLTSFAEELTFAEVYKLEMEEHSPKIDADTVNGYRTSFNYCAVIAPQHVPSLTPTVNQLADNASADVRLAASYLPAHKKPTFRRVGVLVSLHADTALPIVVGVVVLQSVSRVNAAFFQSCITAAHCHALALHQAERPML